MIPYRPARLSMGQSFVQRISPFQALNPAPDQAGPMERDAWIALGAFSTVGLIISGAGTWVGIHTGIKERGLLSFAGWTVGILMGVGALEFLIGVIAAGTGLATQPNQAATPKPAPSQGEYI